MFNHIFSRANKDFEKTCIDMSRYMSAKEITLSFFNNDVFQKGKLLIEYLRKRSTFIKAKVA